MVAVYEDNAGGLALYANGQCWDVTSRQFESCGPGDMLAALDGDTYGWTVPTIELDANRPLPDQLGELVAELVTGSSRRELSIHLYVGCMGTAARHYFGLAR